MPLLFVTGKRLGNALLKFLPLFCVVVVCKQGFSTTCGGLRWLIAIFAAGFFNNF